MSQIYGIEKCFKKEKSGDRKDNSGILRTHVKVSSQLKLRLNPTCERKGVNGLKTMVWGYFCQFL